MKCAKCGSLTRERRIEYKKHWGNKTFKFQHVPATVCLNIKCLDKSFKSDVAKVIEEFIATNNCGDEYVDAPSLLFVSEDVKKLIKDTTIKTESYYVSKYQQNHPDQINLAEIESFWEKKFNSFGSKWNRDRQLYRYLYDNFKLFYCCFEQLKRNKYELCYAEVNKHEYLTKIAGTNVVGVYIYGTRCIDILQKLSLIRHKGFIEKFRKNRNRIFEHNFNLSDNKTITIDPVIWSLGSTDSRLRINIHTDKEAEYVFSVDYYEDYYLLEESIANIIRTF